MERLPLLIDNRNPARIRNLSAAFVSAVHQRDHYVCQYCGFRMGRYHTVVQTLENWREVSSFTTACIFCQQCLYLNAAVQQSSAVIIHFPELDQAELNRLTYELYVARATQGRSYEARKCLDLLMAGRSIARERIQTDDPAILLDRLDQADRSGQREAFQNTLSEFRLFGLDRRIVREADFEFNQYPQILAYMRSRYGPFGGPERKLEKLDAFLETHRTD